MLLGAFNTVYVGQCVCVVGVASTANKSKPAIRHQVSLPGGGYKHGRLADSDI